MILALEIIGSALVAFSVFLFWNITPDVILTDVMELLRPSDRLHIQAENIQRQRRRSDLYAKIQNLRNSLEATGKGKYFPLLFTATGALAIFGIAVAAWLENWFLAPTLVIVLALLPLTYTAKVIERYERSVRDELETALSVVTNAYLRMNDLTAAIGEVIGYIKPPLRDLFEKYLADAAVNPDRKWALYRLRERLDDPVWFEWVTALIQCQDDRTMRDNLQPIVAKLTDVRLVNDQVRGAVTAAKNEYFVIVAFLALNYPLMYSMNREGFEVLVHTPAGKAITGIVAAVVLVTYFVMVRITGTVNYER